MGRLPGSDGRGTMIHAHISEKRAVPLWAVIGAPLVGVPLMVALLALAAPQKEVAGEPEAGVTIEQVEPQAAVHPAEAPVEYMKQERRI